MKIDKAAELIANKSHSIVDDCGDYDLLRKVLTKAFPKDKEGSSYVFSDDDDKIYGYCSNEKGNWANVGTYLTYLQGIPLSEITEDEENVAKKESKGKLYYELDFKFVQQMAERMQSNKENSKYDLWNWKKPMTAKGIDDLKQALLRHVLDVMEGNFDDDGRDFGHLEAIANNAMMINYQFKLLNKE